MWPVSVPCAWLFRTWWLWSCFHFPAGGCVHRWVSPPCLVTSSVGSSSDPPGSIASRWAPWDVFHLSQQMVHMVPPHSQHSRSLQCCIIFIYVNVVYCVSSLWFRWRHWESLGCSSPCLWWALSSPPIAYARSVPWKCHCELLSIVHVTRNYVICVPTGAEDLCPGLVLHDAVNGCLWSPLGTSAAHPPHPDCLHLHLPVPLQHPPSVSLSRWRAARGQGR